jgi:hypothetical protein
VTEGYGKGSSAGTCETMWIIILLYVLVSWQSSQDVWGHSQARCGRGHAHE